MYNENTLVQQQRRLEKLATFHYLILQTIFSNQLGF